MNLGISIIICCFNSSKKLPETIKHIASQQIFGDFDWELIIVDNNSSDKTASTALSLWQEMGQPAHICVIEERRPGLSFARNRGIFSAKYEFCIFCDDDNWLNERYISTAYNYLRNNPKVGILGGHGYPYFESNPPAWINDFYPYYAVGAQFHADGEITSSKGYVYGAGMCIRKSVYQELMNAGFNSLTTDRIGSKLVSGGDIEICFGVRLLGYQIHYLDNLKFTHYIPSTRITESYIINITREISRSSMLLLPYLYSIENRKAGKSVYLFDVMYNLKFLIRDFINFIIRPSSTISKINLVRSYSAFAILLSKGIFFYDKVRVELSRLVATARVNRRC